MSEGNTYVNCTRDGRDGYDLVEWIAAQSWSNERYSMLAGLLHGRLSDVKLQNLVRG